MDLIKVKQMVNLSHSKLNKHENNMRQKLMVMNMIDSLCKNHPVKFMLSCYPMEEVPYQLEQLIVKNVCTREQVQVELRQITPQTRRV